MNQKVIILDFGSQYTQLIARRVRECGIFCEIFPFDVSLNDIDQWSAVILSGSPFSVKDDTAIHIKLTDIIGKVPILAICYGAQLIADQHGGHVHQSQHREYGKAHLHKLFDDVIFDDISDKSQVWMSHADSIREMPDGYKLLASTKKFP